MTASRKGRSSSPHSKQFGISLPVLEAYEEGKLQMDRSPADFSRWCVEKGVDPKAEFLLLLKEYPLRVFALQLLPKSKAWPVLVEGLRSPVPFVAAASATVIARMFPGSEGLREIRDALASKNGKSKYFEDGAIYAMVMIPEAARDQETQALLKKLGLVEKCEKQNTAWQQSKRKAPKQ